MTDRIEPALSAEQWATLAWERGSMWADTRDGALSAGGDYEPLYADQPSDLHALIALANAALPDSDPRKITREWVWRLRKAADCVQAMEGMRKTVNPGPNAQWEGDRYRAFADVLESYLPPEP